MRSVSPDNKASKKVQEKIGRAHYIYEYRYQNSKQNTSKLNPTEHFKNNNNTKQLVWNYHRYVKIIWYFFNP